MAEITDILINYGYMGMFVAAFLAGSFLPFSSEAVMVALLAAGLGPSELVVSGTLGNTLGSTMALDAWAAWNGSKNTSM